MNVNKIFKIKESKTFSNLERQSTEAVEDYAVKKNVNTLEGTIEKVPTDNSYYRQSRYSI